MMMKDMANTVVASRRAIELSPGNVVRRYNYAVNLMLAGDFTTAATEAERVLQSASLSFVISFCDCSETETSSPNSASTYFCLGDILDFRFTITRRSIPTTPKASIDSLATCTERQ